MSMHATYILYVNYFLIVLVPKERRSAFVTGLNRLVPSWNSNELEVNVQHEQETGDSQQKKHCWEKIKSKFFQRDIVIHTVELIHEKG